MNLNSGAVGRTNNSRGIAAAVATVFSGRETFSGSKRVVRKMTVAHGRRNGHLLGNELGNLDSPRRLDRCRRLAECPKRPVCYKRLHLVRISSLVERHHMGADSTACKKFQHQSLYLKSKAPVALGRFLPVLIVNAFWCVRNSLVKFTRCCQPERNNVTVR